MKTENIFFLIVQLMLMLLVGVCAIFCETSIELSHVVSTAKAKKVIEYCQGKKDAQYAGVTIFNKDGEKYKTVGQIRGWDLQKEERDKRLDVAKEHSNFYKQLKLRNVVVCKLKQNPRFFNPWGDRTIALVMGTADCSVCERIKEYYERNEN
jgi:hypothetical protein